MYMCMDFSAQKTFFFGKMILICLLLLQLLVETSRAVDISSVISPLIRRSPFDSLLWSFRENKLNSIKGSSSLAVNNFRSFSCTDRAEQLYPDLASGCSSYYRCLGGVSYSYICPKNSLFDKQRQKCRPADDVFCSIAPPTTEKCSYQTDGFYPNYEEGCTSYYRCENGSVDEEGKCDDNATWDSSTGSCGYGVQNSCTPPSCEGLPEGYYPLQGSSCKAYYYCSGGNRTDMLCPPGSIFDYMKKECIFGRKAVCYEGACEGRTNGLHAAPDAPCNTYYRCFNGAMIALMKCPKGQIFNGQTCTFAHNYSCWGSGGGSCDKRPDGFYQSDDSNCRGFFYCGNRQVIRNFHCARGLVFDGETCVVNDSNFICNGDLGVPDCTHKFDGYYTVEKTKCKRFFKCTAGEKISEHLCPGNQVFNGNRCVDSSLYSCSGRENGNAVSKNIFLFRSH